MSFDVVSQSHCFGGTQFVYRHKSSETGTSMRFSAYVPPQAAGSDVPVVWFLAGLTCTEETFILKAGAQRLASELGLILVSPDTSPRGEGVPGDPEKAWDFASAQGLMSTPCVTLGRHIITCAPTSSESFRRWSEGISLRT
jgi:S-formylglutathione hydrolase